MSRFGQVDELKGDYESTYKLIWGDMAGSHRLTCNPDYLVCKKSMLPNGALPLAAVQIGSTIPGVFEVVAEGTLDHTLQKNVWLLQSIQNIVLESGRYFEIYLDFIHVRISPFL